MTNKQTLGALALDLKRAALGLHRKSFVIADRFLREAKKRNSEADSSLLMPYMREILQNLDTVIANSNIERKAEDLLMYSTLIQNYALHKS